MRFHVLGVGAIGRLVSHHLRRTLPPSHSVTIIHKTSRQLREFIAESGNTIDVERDGMLAKSTGGWKADPPQIESLIVVTKAHKVLDAIKSLLPRLSPNVTIVLLQNGMGVYEELIYKIFPNEQIRPHFILCSNTHGAFIKENDIVVHSGIGNLEIGIVPDPVGRDFEANNRNENVPLYNRALSLDDIATPDDPNEIRYRSLRATVEALTSLEEMRVSWKPISEMQIALRRKLVVNVAINTLTALMHCRNGELLQSQAATGFIMKICLEAEFLFAAEHAAGAKDWLDNISEGGLNADNFRLDRLPIGLTRASLYDEVLRVAEVTKGNISSMLVDVKAGKTTELDYITGYLLNLGQKYGVRLSRIAALHYLIKARGEIPQDQILLDRIE